MKFFRAFLIFFLLPAGLVAQHALPDTIDANYYPGIILLDGKTDDSVWQHIAPINNFTQRELNFGEAASEKTEVRIAYDKFAIYFAINCYMNDPSMMSAKFMQRDFDYWSDDNFQVALSPFNDRRNGYLFVINPNGARADELISNGEEGTMDWNGVWDAKTSRNSTGWFAEIKIPFSTLQFNKDSLHHWAVNFERDIKRKNEEDLWQGWSRDYSIFSLVNAGTLSGIGNIGYAKHFEFKPYALGGWNYERSNGFTYPYKIGGDLNINLTPTLKMNITANTDFAQIESDRIPVNLSRFAIDYPEKRDFFLEGYNSFEFYMGNSNTVFYTRTIGIEQLQTVPIIAGTRVFGKVGKNNIGLLDIQEGKFDTTSSHNDLVLRYKRDVGPQSYIGGIFTNKAGAGTSNQVAGIDASYTTSKFLHHRNLVVAGNIAQSMNDFRAEKNSLAYRIYSDYPNDLVDHFIAVSSLQQNFDPQLGFIQRKNYEAFNWHLVIMPRIFTKYGVRKMNFKPFELAALRTQSTHQFESFYNETRIVGAEFKSGESFEVNLRQTYDRLDEQFNITDSIYIPVGHYFMHVSEFAFSTFHGRRFWFDTYYNWGTFYTGKIQNYNASLGVNFSRHMNMNADYNYNLVRFQKGNVATNEIALYFNYAFTTKIDISVFGQYNSFDDLMRLNFRLHWIPRIGSDLYFVYNQGHDNIKQLDMFRPQSTTGVAKLVYRFAF
ncbi:MAG: carbohydrate binding family 9 domain-containing protein [Bacteroidetes bacterium]|nr:carbohydrate binding family 9 domain-containing protein [Bacteroidota bacterium]